LNAQFASDRMLVPVLAQSTIIHIPTQAFNLWQLQTKKRQNSATSLFPMNDTPFSSPYQTKHYSQINN